MSKEIDRLIGRTFEPYSFTIERGKVREFVEAVGDPNLIYRNQQTAVEQGYRDCPLPPTFATVIDFWGGPDFFALCDKLELNSLNVLHGEQEYEYIGDLYPEDTVTAYTKVADAKGKAGSGSRGMHVITLETRYHNQENECVLIGRSTVIERI